MYHRVLLYPIPNELPWPSNAQFTFRYSFFNGIGKRTQATSPLTTFVNDDVMWF
ncbi:MULTISPECIES: hypothetical protein [Enterococcus]|uniref:hypothetical protein n=1 Tax=Enterococcus TaxID=1350 RepID=UPI001A8FFC74|nr:MULTISPECIES: hypothetical protein [unclassified Enterococcus]MCD1024480.1 hypothetical protein [Enterococcus sp. SMC-9]